MSDKNWDDESNEAQNNFLTWGKPASAAVEGGAPAYKGDCILGTMVTKKQVPSTLPDKKGEMQWVYEVKVKECVYHAIDERTKQPTGDPIVVEAGELVKVGGRSFYDSRLARVKIGQIFGLKFLEELEPKTKGYNPTKVIKVYTPKGDDGEFLKDQEFLDSLNEGDDGFGGW